MNTRSLSVANTGNFINTSLEDLADLALLYYENPTGNVSALCQVSYDVNKGSWNESNVQRWIDITTQESKSLPDVFRNAPSSAAASESKTLDESLALKNFTLSAPFTSQITRFQQPGIRAFFYSPASIFGHFPINMYLTGPSGPGNFSPSMVPYSCAP